MDETSLISTSKVLQVGLLFSETLMMKVAVAELDFTSDAVEAARRRVVKLICEGSYVWQFMREFGVGAKIHKR
jgi:hypothetical protein